MVKAEEEKGIHYQTPTSRAEHPFFTQDIYLQDLKVFL